MKESKIAEKRDIVLWDELNDIKFKGRSSAKTFLTIEFEGKTYPLIKIKAVKI